MLTETGAQQASDPGVLNTDAAVSARAHSSGAERVQLLAISVAALMFVVAGLLGPSLLFGNDAIASPWTPPAQVEVDGAATIIEPAGETLAATLEPCEGAEGEPVDALAMCHADANAQGSPPTLTTSRQGSAARWLDAVRSVIAPWVAYFDIPV